MALRVVFRTGGWVVVLACRLLWCFYCVVGDVVMALVVVVVFLWWVGGVAMSFGRGVAVALVVVLLLPWVCVGGGWGGVLPCR